MAQGYLFMPTTESSAMNIAECSAGPSAPNKKPGIAVMLFT
jgi:hypothetical protein